MPRRKAAVRSYIAPPITDAPESSPDGLIDVVLLDDNRTSSMVHRIDPEARRYRVHWGGITYEHCDTLPDGTWRYAPAK